jgi:hypothetical protein
VCGRTQNTDTCGTPPGPSAAGQDGTGRVLGHLGRGAFSTEMRRALQTAAPAGKRGGAGDATVGRSGQTAAARACCFNRSRWPRARPRRRTRRTVTTGERRRVGGVRVRPEDGGLRVAVGSEFGLRTEDCAWPHGRASATREAARTVAAKPQVRAADAAAAAGGASGLEALGRTRPSAERRRRPGGARRGRPRAPIGSRGQGRRGWKGTGGW